MMMVCRANTEHCKIEKGCFNRVVVVRISFVWYGNYDVLDVLRSMEALISISGSQIDVQRALPNATACPIIKIHLS